MSAPIETESVSDEGVYTLYLTREEGLAIWDALDDLARPTAASVRVMYRLAARLKEDT